MSIRTKPWPNGVPCWADLTVPDVAAAQAFYGAVLGWEFAPPNEEFGGYVIAERRGAAAAGIGPLQDGSPAWTLYLASDDADATQAAVTANGGTVVMPAGDVGPLGRMFLATDPTGAFFGVWQAGTHLGAALTSEHGGITWEDLRSPDPDAARAFYGALFGYRFDPMGEMAPPDYTTFQLPNEEAPLGGIGGMFGVDAPPHWLVYFGVDDTKAAAEAARNAGGTIFAEPFPTEFGTMAAIGDPFGAGFMLVETDGSYERKD